MSESSFQHGDMFKNSIESRQAAFADGQLMTEDDPLLHDYFTGAGEANLEIRNRGNYITIAELFSPSMGQTIEVLYSDLSIVNNDRFQRDKVYRSQRLSSGTHSMVPAGKYEGIGKQHGFPRWCDYALLFDEITEDGEIHAAFQAKRSDDGLSLARSYILNESSLEITTTIQNQHIVDRPEKSDKLKEETSMGDHYYFVLKDEDTGSLRVDGKSINELGVKILDAENEDSYSSPEEALLDSKTLFWDFPDGKAEISFPGGYKINLSAFFEGDSEQPIGLWIWKRPGTESICFEPVVGVDENLNNDGIRIEPGDTATLSTKIEIL